MTPPDGEFRSTASGKVLVVDDDSSVRAVIVLMLEEFDFEVVEAEDGAEGIRAFREHADDLDAVVLDVSLPDMQGTDVFRELRAIRPEVPVVLTSGNNEPETRARFERMGIDAFLGKPFSPIRLVQTLTRVRAASAS